jgi:hypothetical protein
MPPSAPEETTKDKLITDNTQIIEESPVPSRSSASKVFCALEETRREALLSQLSSDAGSRKLPPWIPGKADVGLYLKSFPISSDETLGGDVMPLTYLAIASALEVNIAAADKSGCNLGVNSFLVSGFIYYKGKLSSWELFFSRIGDIVLFCINMVLASCGIYFVYSIWEALIPHYSLKLEGHPKLVIFAVTFVSVGVMCNSYIYSTINRSVIHLPPFEALSFTGHGIDYRLADVSNINDDRGVPPPMFAYTPSVSPTRLLKSFVVGEQMWADNLFSSMYVGGTK